MLRRHNVFIFIPLWVLGGVATSGIVGLSALPGAIAVEPTTLAQATIRPTVRSGSTGTAVSELQAILSLLGYFPHPVDGKFQGTTEAAVKKFQQEVGLTADGIVGPATWERLLPTPSTNFDPPPVPPPTATPPAAAQPTRPPANQADLPTLRPGMNGTAVTRVQEALKARGFYKDVVDGVFGPATEAAVMAFQRSVQLVPDGVVGPATWQALLR